MNMQYVYRRVVLSDSDIFVSVPQSEETRAELSQIAWVPRQVGFSSLFSS